MSLFLCLSGISLTQHYRGFVKRIKSGDDHTGDGGSILLHTLISLHLYLNKISVYEINITYIKLKNNVPSWLSPQSLCGNSFLYIYIYIYIYIYTIEHKMYIMWGYIMLVPMNQISVQQVNQAGLPQQFF